MRRSIGLSSIVVAVVAGCSASSNGPTLIGPSGGTVTGSDGTRIEVPAGAVAQGTSITIGPSPVSAPQAVGDAFLFGPEGQTFSVPVQVVLPFSPARLAMGAT